VAYPAWSNHVPVDHIRRLIIEQSKRANVGHIGCALSVADLVESAYDHLIRHDRTDRHDRDRFVLSKGHAALALYAGLHLRGQLSAEQLATYCADDTLLGVHPEHFLIGVDFSTGSLGQGLSMAAGAALAARLQRSSRRIVALMSDAECNEGAVWEAAAFAAHHRLANMIAIVDLNGQQAFGHTRDVLNMSNMADRWRAFEWDVHEVDGHDRGQLRDVMGGLDFTSGPPHVLVARTTFGKGVSFMESVIKWHYSPLSDDEYNQSLRELGVLA
jgi:transketolase